MKRAFVLVMFCGLACLGAAHAAEPRRGLPNGPVDPLERLREKLAARLAAPPLVASAPAGELRLVAATRADAAVRPAAPPRAIAARAKAPPPAKPSVHWSYEGAGGPAHWASIDPEYATCASGQRQSPIDYRDSFAVAMEPIAFDYRPGGFRVVDTGRTVQVHVAPGNTIEVHGRRYELVQLHFHHPAEETIDGKRYAMSLHLLHRDAAGRLAVVGLLLDEGAAAHPVLQQVWANLPLERGDELAARTPIDLAALLPAERGHYATMGSLTTPPCSEGVLWLVMKQPVVVSPEQVRLFARLYPMNARPIQRSAGRMIKESSN